MQPLLDGPRKDLTETEVRNLLQSHSTIQITYGAMAMDGDFTDVADITDYVSAGSITSAADNTVHRTCVLTIDASVTDSGWSYLSGFVRPYMTFTDVATGLSAQFDLGVYTLTTPTRAVGVQNPALSFQGYDLCYLLNQQIADSYEVPQGSDPAQAAADVISLAIPEVSVLVTPSGSTLATRLTWPFDAHQPVTFLQIIQTLLGSIGYREPWVDWEGVFRVEPFIDLQDADYEWSFNYADDDNLVAEDVTQDIDLFDVPNWWRFVMANLSDTPVEGETQFTYTDASTANPGSTANRGRVIRKIVEVSAATYDDLVAYAQRVITTDMRPGETFAVKTQPFPLAWHLDVIQWLNDSLDDALPLAPGGERRVVSTGWTLDITGQQDMQWTWQTVSDQIADVGLVTQVVTA